MSTPFSASYSSKRDKESSASDDAFMEILMNKFNITEIRKCYGDEDYKGIDFVGTLADGNDVTIQKKALEYKKYDTVTITENEYLSGKYKKIDILFHCYYDKADPKKIIQYSILDMQTYLKLLSNFIKQRNKKSSKTDFVYVDYDVIKTHYKEYYNETRTDDETYVITDIEEPIFG
jgi:hypothetical protein